MPGGAALTGPTKAWFVGRVRRSRYPAFLRTQPPFLFLKVIANLFLFFNHRLAFWHAAIIKTLHKRAGR
ncbi:hypothetical protein ENTCAN_09597 [Enterobacter cancerogenus ATCC 35316]|nr:hypothetical protein ENTCAN_09597 [Enterobacter cancerogenus ATCC 35316]